MRDDNKNMPAVIIKDGKPIAMRVGKDEFPLYPQRCSRCGHTALVDATLTHIVARNTTVIREYDFVRQHISPTPFICPDCEE